MCTTIRRWTWTWVVIESFPSFQALFLRFGGQMRSLTRHQFGTHPRKLVMHSTSVLHLVKKIYGLSESSKKTIVQNRFRTASECGQICSGYRPMRTISIVSNDPT